MARLPEDAGAMSGDVPDVRAQYAFLVLMTQCGVVRLAAAVLAPDSVLTWALTDDLVRMTGTAQGISLTPAGEQRLMELQNRLEWGLR